VLDRWADCWLLITFGTPHRGSVDPLGYVANGYKRILPVLTQVLRSCPSVYELMPIYEAVFHEGAWKRATDPSVTVPHAFAGYVAAGERFHREIEDAVTEHLSDERYLQRRYAIVPYVGFGQTTLQSAELDGEVLRTSVKLPEVIPPDLGGGDGRVPRPSGTPLEYSEQLQESFLAEQHGSLQTNVRVLDDLVERLVQSQSVRALSAIRGQIAARPPIDVRVDDLYLPDEAVTVDATTPWAGELVVRLQPEGGQGTEIAVGGGELHVVVDDVLPGRYRVTVGPRLVGPGDPAPVTALFERA
jgi:hypothetical protein